MKKLALIFALAILNFSCSKDDEPNKTPSKPKLTTFTQSDGIDYAITYNGETPTGIESDGANGNIINNPIVFNTQGYVTNVGSESYLYNANNLINRVVTGDNNQNCVLEYNGQNQLVRETINMTYNNGTTYYCRRDFTYTGNLATTITESSTIYYAGGTPNSFKLKYDLNYDSKGNIVQLSEYEKNLSGNYVLKSTTTYTYDDKPNPWKELLVDKTFKNQFIVSESPIIENKSSIVIGDLSYFRIQYISNNNFIKVKRESNSGSILENNYQNTYNSENYITNVTTITTFNSQIQSTLYNSYTYN